MLYLVLNTQRQFLEVGGVACLALGKYYVSWETPSFDRMTYLPNKTMRVRVTLSNRSIEFKQIMLMLRNKHELDESLAVCKGTEI